MALGVIGGSVPFILFFTGLSEVTAPGAAVIHKTLFVWVALLAVVFLRERIGALQIAALVILLASQLLIQSPAGVGWGSGETMIAIATGFWAVEVIVAKRLLADTPSPVAAAARMGIGLRRAGRLSGGHRWPVRDGCHERGAVGLGASAPGCC